MIDKIKNNIVAKLGIGSLSPILFTLGIIIFCLSSIIVDSEKPLDLPWWVGVSIIFLGWHIGNKYNADFGAKFTQKMLKYVVLLMLILIFTAIYTIHIFING